MRSINAKVETNLEKGRHMFYTTMTDEALVLKVYAKCNENPPKQWILVEEKIVPFSDMIPVGERFYFGDRDITEEI